MKNIRKMSLALSLLAASALPALASITVYTPGNGTTVAPQFTLSAAANNCSNQAIAAMGFSLDSSSNTTIVKAATIDAQVTSATGAHTLHVKAWGTSGASCVTDVALNVVSGTTSSTTTTTTSSTPTTTTTSSTGAVNGITVTTPTSNQTVQTPFSLNASAPTCSSQAVTAMGYSLDNSSNTAIVQSNSVLALVSTSTGAHTLHVKAWGNSGAVCVDSIAINVTSTSTSTTSTSTASTGGVTITSPENGASVTSPIPVAANAATCSSQAVTAIGYGLDNATKTIYTGTSLSTQVPATAGSHILHVTAWGNGGAICNGSVTVNVTDTASPTNSIVPSNAVSVSSIQALSTWQAAHDPATGSTSSGTMALVGSPSLSGNARQFNTSFSNSGGEIYHVAFGDDPTSTNFLYDAWVYFSGSASNVANLEMDMNQVMSNGQTVIYGFQCDGYSGTWDYTENAGTPSNPSDHWIHSSAACNVRNWTVNSWHHIQVSYSRDSSGNVTYHSVWLDGTQAPLNATVPSAFALGWSQVLLTNFQIDGLGSGSNTVYIDKLTISRW